MDYRLSEILTRYGGSKDGAGLRIPCPIHHGKDNNCAVWIDDHDKIAATCHSHGCDVTKFLWEAHDPPPKRGPISKELKAQAVWLPDEPGDLFEPPRVFKQGGASKSYSYTSQYQYTNIEGGTINLVVVRYDNPMEKGDKVTIPFIYARLPDGRSTWISRGPQGPQWYGLHTVPRHNKILVCEGEKTANAAWNVVKDRMGVLSWLGGSNKAAQLDLSVLDGKEVVLWPDYDEPGFKWAWKGSDNLYDRLRERGCVVSVVMWDGGEGSDAADCKDAQTVWDAINEADTPDKFRLEAVYGGCAAAQELALTEDTAKVIPCGVAETCSNCMYKYIPAITHPIDILNADPVLHTHAYIRTEDCYVDLRTFETFSKSVFDNHCAHLPGYSLAASSTASRQFQESSGTLSVRSREFRPGEPLMIDGKINLATQLEWTHQTDDPELWHRLGKHLFSPEELEHILDWLAFTIQRPAEKIEHTLLITGAQGAGKSLFFSPIELALQRVNQHKTVNSSQLTGSFNDFLVNTKLVTMEELNFASSGFSGSNKLKEWQASPPHYININPKFAKPFEIPNIVNIIAYSNFELPAKLEVGQRRWYVVKTNVGRLDKEDWYSYDSFNGMLSDHYVDKILSYLARRDITHFKRGNAPETEAGHEMEMLSIAGMRDLGPTIDELEWTELVEMKEVKERLERELGPSRHITDTALRKILQAKGWTNLGRTLAVQGGRRVRPWATARGEMYEQMRNDQLRELWQKRYGAPTHHQHTTN